MNQPERDSIIAATLLVSLIGYEVFAPWMQAFAPDSSLPSMVLRVGILAACAVAALKHRSHWTPIRIQALPMFGFILLYALRLFDNFFVQGYKWEATPDLAFSFLIGASLVPAFFLHRLVNHIDERRFVQISLFGMALFIVGLAASWDQILASIVVSRIVLDKLNPISLGYVCTTQLLVLFLLPPRTFRAGAAWSVTAAVLALALTFSQARGQILSMGLLLPLMAWSQPAADRRRLLMLLAVPVALLAAVAISTDVNLVDIFLARFEDLDVDESADGRRAAWAASWPQFMDHPWIGYKVFEPTLRQYPHNIFIESLLALGIVGGLLMAAHLMLVLRAVAAVLRDDRAGLIPRFLALFALKEVVAAMFSGAIWSDTSFWIGSACVLGLSMARRHESLPRHKPLQVAAATEPHR